MSSPLSPVRLGLTIASLLFTSSALAAPAQAAWWSTTTTLHYSLHTDLITSVALSMGIPNHCIQVQELHLDLDMSCSAAAPGKRSQQVRCDIQSATVSALPNKGVPSDADPIERAYEQALQSSTLRADATPAISRLEYTVQERAAGRAVVSLTGQGSAQDPGFGPIQLHVDGESLVDLETGALMAARKDVRGEFTGQNAGHAYLHQHSELKVVNSEQTVSTR